MSCATSAPVSSPYASPRTPPTMIGALEREDTDCRTDDGERDPRGGDHVTRARRRVEAAAGERNRGDEPDREGGHADERGRREIGVPEARHGTRAEPPGEGHGDDVRAAGAPAGSPRLRRTARGGRGEGLQWVERRWPASRSGELARASTAYGTSERDRRADRHAPGHRHDPVRADARRGCSRGPPRSPRRSPAPASRSRRGRRGALAPSPTNRWAIGRRHDPAQRTRAGVLRCGGPVPGQDLRERVGDEHADRDQRHARPPAGRSRTPRPSRPICAPAVRERAEVAPRRGSPARR